MSTLNAQMIEKVRTLATQECIELALAMVDETDGVGDHDLSREDRIARFVDYAQRGVLDALKGMGAPVYNTLVKEFVSDMEHSPYMQERE